MANVKLRVRALRRACATIILILVVITAMALSLAVASNAFATEVAYADNDGAIGSGGGDISIQDVTEYATVNSKKITFIGATKGVKLLIRMPSAVTDIYVYYEADCNDEDYKVIEGDDYSGDKDIRYKRIDAAGDNHARYPDAVLFQAEWTAPTVSNGKVEFSLTVHGNGDLSVLGVVSSDEDEEEKFMASWSVMTIDWNPPTLTEAYCYKVAQGDGRYVLSCCATFSDKEYTSFDSAMSGISYICIFRTDEPVTTGGDSADEAAAFDVIAEYYRNGSGDIVIPSSVVPTKEIEFDISRDGYYYYYVDDRVMNIEALRPLFGEEKVVVEVDERFIVDVNVGSVETHLNVENYMLEYGAVIERNKDKVNAALYNSINREYSDLMLSFMSSDSEVSQKYWNFVSNAYSEFLDKAANGADYSVKVVNGDLLLGELGALNLNADIVAALGGDDVIAEFIVARFTSAEADSEVLAAADIKNVTDVYRLKYKLTVNGVQNAVPSASLIFEIKLSLPDSLKSAALIVKSPSGYSSYKLEEGVNYVRFSTLFNEAEYYLVTEEVKKGDNSALLPLWITLGVVGGLAVIGGITLLIIKKRGLPRGKERKASHSDSDNADSQSDSQGDAKASADLVATSGAKAKKPANKSKKKRKK